jgi:hypothetical protein
MVIKGSGKCMIQQVSCTNCGKKGNLIFRGDNELRIPYNWEGRFKSQSDNEDFELLCEEDGCWNKEEEENEGM